MWVRRFDPNTTVQFCSTPRSTCEASRLSLSVADVVDWSTGKTTATPKLSVNVTVVPVRDGAKPNAAN